MKLLVISNGHGEDVIAIRIVEELLNSSHKLEIAALPIVGRGNAYTRLNIPIAGKVKQMPSGGFIYQDGRQFWRDMQGGLLQLTLEQYQVVRQWSRDRCFILAVGDIVPLLFAWMSGTDYAFVGTAKSEYYLRDDRGWLSKTSPVERALGSVYLPWERFLMSRFRCKAVFPRDTITTKILQKWSIPAFDLGNPMIDGIGFNESCSVRKNNLDDELIILLLPGSRMPEAESNWQTILAGVDNVIATFKKLNLVFLTAIAPDLNIDFFQKDLLDRNWYLQAYTDINSLISDPECLAFNKQNATLLLLTQNAYKNCLVNSDLAIAMAGTATEQFVGLGKPAFIIPGEGPQFTYTFAEAQTRLLGESVILVEQTDLIGNAIASLLNDRDRIEKIAINGKKRMGDPGAASRIAKSLLETIFSNN
jgi:uncharacterized protein (TIGR03492 family)